MMVVESPAAVLSNASFGELRWSAPPMADVQNNDRFTLDTVED
jgi:hypothetical protein